MPCLVAIIDSTHGSATVSFKNLVTVGQENFTNQTADVLVEDQLQPLSGLVKGSPKRVLHNPNSRAKDIHSVYNTEHEVVIQF